MILLGKGKFPAFLFFWQNGQTCAWVLVHEKFSVCTRSSTIGGNCELFSNFRRSTYNHLSSWLTDARNLTNPNTVSVDSSIKVTIDDHFSTLFLTFQVIFLIGNKSDLDAQRDVTYEEAKQFAEENGM